MTSGMIPSRGTDLTALNSAQSPLLRIPGELRNKIYMLASGYNVIIPITYRNQKDGAKLYCHIPNMTLKGNSSTWKRPDLPFVVPVLRIFNLREICRQTRAEIDPLQPYRSNIFTFRDPCSMAWFSDTLTAHQRNAIKHVALPHVDIFLQVRTNSASIRNMLPGITQVLITGLLPVTIHDAFIALPTKARHLFRLGCSPDVALEVRIVDLFESTVAVEGAPGFVIHP